MTKYMTVKEFVDSGFLFELNRRVLHPFGLALEVVQEADGFMSFGGVWDCRDDPEGIVFAEMDFNEAVQKWAVNMILDGVDRIQKRKDLLGYVVQIHPDEPKDYDQALDISDLKPGVRLVDRFNDDMERLIVLGETLVTLLAADPSYGKPVVMNTAGPDVNTVLAAVHTVLAAWKGDALTRSYDPRWPLARAMDALKAAVDTLNGKARGEE